jgi:hypothetical protein
MRGSGITRRGATVDNQPEKEMITIRGNDATRGRCSGRDEKAVNSDADRSKVEGILPFCYRIKRGKNSESYF